MKPISLVWCALFITSIAIADGPAKVYRQAVCEAIDPATNKMVQATGVGTHRDGLTHPSQMRMMAETAARTVCERNLLASITGSSTGTLRGSRVLKFNDCQSKDESSCSSTPQAKASNPKKSSDLNIVNSVCFYVDESALKKIDSAPKSVCVNEAVCRVEAQVKDSSGKAVDPNPIVKIRTELACPALASGECPQADTCFKNTDVKIVEAKVVGAMDATGQGGGQGARAKEAK